MLYLAVEPREILGGQCLGGDYDDRDALPAGFGAHLRDELEPVHLGHHQIEQNCVGKSLVQTLETNPTILCLRDRAIELPQGAPHQLTGRSVILDYQHVPWRAPWAALFHRTDQSVTIDRLDQIIGGAEREANSLVVDDRGHDHGNFW